MATVFSDDFNRANGALGSNWTTDLGSFSIVSNHMESSTTMENACRATGYTPASADYKVSVKRLNTNGHLSATVRATSGDNFYLFQTASDNALAMYRRTSGGWQQLGSNIAHTAANGDVVSISAQGTTIKGYINGVEKVSATDSGITAAGYGGIRTYINIQIDDFVIEDFGGGDPPAVQLAKVNGIALTSIAKYQGIAKAAISKVNGLTIQ